MISLAVFEGGRNGRMLAEWVLDVVKRLVESFHPERIIPVVGSVVRGEGG